MLELKFYCIPRMNHYTQIGLVWLLLQEQLAMYIDFKKQVYDDQTLIWLCSPEREHKWMHIFQRKLATSSYTGCLKDNLVNSLIKECGCVLSADYLSSKEQYPLCTYSQLHCYSIATFFSTPPDPCKTACKHATFEIISTTHTTTTNPDSNYMKVTIVSTMKLSVFRHNNCVLLWNWGILCRGRRSAS